MTALRFLFDDLVRTEILLWDAVDRRLRDDLGLPLGRVQALRALDEHPDRRVQDVADALGVTVGAASKLVDRLETAGLCTRRPHPTDRRSSLLEATPTGREARLHADEVVDRELQDRLAVLPPHMLTQLAELIAAARRRLMAD